MNALITWTSRYGLPDWLITDGGPHFANSALEEATKRMGIDHKITLAYSPWTNGSVENMGKQLLWLLRSLISEFSLNVTDWDVMLPVVQYCCNHRILDSLNQRSPLEVMTGRRPRQAIDLALWEGIKLKSANKIDMNLDKIDSFCDKLIDALQKIHSDTRNRQEHRLMLKAAREAKKKGNLRFCIGDLVLVSSTTNAANHVRSHKLQPLWLGPYEIVASKGPTRFSVQLFGASQEIVDVHWTQIKRLGSSELQLSERDIEDAKFFFSSV